MKINVSLHLSYLHRGSLFAAAAAAQIAFGDSIEFSSFLLRRVPLTEKITPDHHDPDLSEDRHF
jgi:hypothetical protein